VLAADDDALALQCYGPAIVKLAKPHLDVGLMTNALEPMRTFWQQQVGLAHARRCCRLEAA
jgi:hypothetical protein